MIYEYQAQAVRVIDGDTVRFKVDVGFYITFEENFRLSGIDAPELRDKDPEKKARAKKAKIYLAALLPQGEVVTIRTAKADKYGRWLATVLKKDETNVNEDLVQKGHAVKRTAW